jgi:hypothetical protein
MNELNLKIRDYREAKGNAVHFAERLQEKRAEIAEMEVDLVDARNEINELQNRLATSGREMAIGRLSTDQFMELKREITEKENQVNLLSEAIEAQKGGLAMIRDDHKINRREQNEFLKRSAADLSDQLADDVVALAGDRIQDLAQALVAAKGKSRAFTGHERQRDREAIYLAIGEALCRRVFQAETGSLDFVPDLLQARQHISELINRATPQIG